MVIVYDRKWFFAMGQGRFWGPSTKILKNFLTLTISHLKFRREFEFIRKVFEFQSKIFTARLLEPFFETIMVVNKNDFQAR